MVSRLPARKNEPEPLPTVVQRGEVPGARWEMAIADPHAALRPFVAGYAGCREVASEPVRRRELPGRHLVWILDLAQTVTIAAQGAPLGRPGPDGFVVGLSTSPWRTQTPGTMDAIEVDLTPLGAARLLGVPLGQLAAVALPTEACFDALSAHALDDLVEVLRQAPSWVMRFAHLEAFLLRRLERPARLPSFLAHAWGRIDGAGPPVSIDALARELACSRRHLSGAFHEAFGLAPKPALRLCRFSRAAALIREGQAAAHAPSMAAIALAAGYFDQAHMSREFRAFAGITPSRYATDNDREQLGMPA